jgi:hypothetical protein
MIIIIEWVIKILNKNKYYNFYLILFNILSKKLIISPMILSSNYLSILLSYYNKHKLINYSISISNINYISYTNSYQHINNIIATYTN